MIVPPNFTPGKKYALDGETLQALFDAVATSQILPSDEYELEVTPKKGTRLKGVKASGVEAKPWDLTRVGDNFTMPKPGRIYTSYSDASSLLSIVDWDLEFALGAGKLAWLELTFDETLAPVVTLKAGDPPTGWPVTIEFSEPPAVPAVTKAFFELYEGISGTLPAEEWGTQYDGYWVRKSFRHGDSVLIWGSHELEDEFTGVPVPILAPR